MIVKRFLLNAYSNSTTKETNGACEQNSNDIDLKMNKMEVFTFFTENTVVEKTMKNGQSTVKHCSEQ